jgi:gliding motility-associated-like protein
LCEGTIIFAQTPGPGCPSVNAGPDQVLPCNTACANLSATIFQTGQTTSYQVASIPFNPPYAFNQGNPFFINIDDVWSDVINLPFTFCFYGNSYTQLVVGANGIISFDLSYAGDFCPWQYNQTIPDNGLPLNAIFGAYHDVDPSVCGNIRYALLGSWPCRTFVFNYDAVCHYSCNNLKTTQQIVLYENTNVIEVYIQSKPTCNSWNSGNAVIGIQDANGAVGLTPPGRNTGPWSANNEAWRFTPNGAANYTINWYEGNDSTNSLGTTTNIQVCPTTTFTTYSAILTYTNCDNNTVTVWDAVDVSLTSPPAPQISSNSPICQGGSLQFSANTIPNATYYWSGPNNFSSSLEDPLIANPTAANSGTYSLYVVQNGCTSATVTTDVLVGNPPVPQLSYNGPICSGEDLMLMANTVSGASYFWSGPNNILSGQEDTVIAGATTSVSGQYSAFMVVGGCTSAVANLNVVVNPIPLPPVLGSNTPVCLGSSINLTSTGIPNATYVWSGPANFSSALQNPSIPDANFSMSGDYSAYMVVNNCTSSVSTVPVSIIDGPVASFSASPLQGCVPLTVNFSDLSSGGLAPFAYQWQFGTGSGSAQINPSHTYNQPGTYSVTLTVTDANGCISSDNQTNLIQVYDYPIAGFSILPQVVYMDAPFSQILDGSSGGVVNWNYTVSNGNSYSTPNFLVSFSDTGTYAITQVVSNELGCSDELTQYLEVRPISEVFVPNSFTPGNRDNLNGVFKPVASNISNYKLMIFNRWGELVFSSVELDQGWDGKIRSSKVDAKNDVYVWKIEYWDHIGTERQLLGHVTLIR